ncbi:hypothetical protein C2S52_010147 [Perilla frutescens var. hirtella]|nr:hypothetical protein C2S52_010147 [Perilla frutescens var. hirtella]
MVSAAVENLLRDIKLSTVVPASITGEDKNHHFTNLDLALKLHYITTVHFFGGDAAAGLTIHDFKKPMFLWLQLYYPISGRIRRQDGGGRPYIKCNDSGVRIVEATCTKTVAEWLAAVNGGDHHRLLVYDQPLLAHDFGFTPLVFLQLTKFECGGLCVGMRWAHFLGDAVSATDCINMWAKIMANQVAPPQLLPTPTTPTTHHHPPPPLSAVKLLESVGDNWLAPNNSRIQSHTLHITEEQLSNLLSRERNKNNAEIIFQVISALIWKSMARIREAKIVTVCKNTKSDLKNDELPSNARMVIGVVEAESTVMIADADPLEIAKMIAENFVDQTSVIDREMEEGEGKLDFVVYGSNLTFLNLEGLDLYGLEIKGRRPIFGSISVGGVGDGGAVVVAPDAGGGGRVVNLILPEDQLHHLKNVLRVEWGIL